MKRSSWIWWLVVVLAALLVARILARPARSRGPLQLLPSPALALRGLSSSLFLLTAGGDLWLWDCRGRSRRWSQPWHVSGPPAPWICYGEGYVALAALDGRLLVRPWAVVGKPWSKDLGESPATVPALGSGAVLVCGESGCAHLFDLATGEQLAGLDLQAPACAAPQWWQGQWWIPVRGNRIVRVSSEGRAVLAYGLRGQALATACSEAGVWVSLAPAGLDLVNTQGVRAHLEMQEVAPWLLAFGDTLLAFTTDGGVTAVKAGDAGRVEVLWKRHLPGLPTAVGRASDTQAAARVAVALRSGRVLVLDAASGRVLSSLRFPSRMLDALALGEGWVAAASDDGAWLCRIR